MGFVEGLSTAALSLVIAGNEGIAPFLTLFLVAAIEKFNPDILAMDQMMENLIASWPGLTFLGIMSIVEFVAKCVPVVDEAVDGVMLFIVPIMSVLGSLSTFGLYGGQQTEVEGGDGGEDGNERRLEVAPLGAAIRFFQVVIILIGVGLAVSMHLTKMLVRLLGEGWLTGIITILEIGFCIASVIFAIFVRQIAILLAVVMLSAAGFTLKRKWWDKRKKEEAATSGSPANEGDIEGDFTAATDAEESKENGN